MTFLIYAWLFLGFLVLAALHDLADLRIPNRLTAAMAATGPIAMALLGPGPDAVPAALLCGAATLAVTWAMFEFGWLGGGDAKLASATALWLGPEAMAIFVLVAALCGSLLAAALFLMSRWHPVHAFVGVRWRDRLQAGRVPVPYAAAMAPAGAAAMFALFSQVA